LKEASRFYDDMKTKRKKTEEGASIISEKNTHGPQDNPPQQKRKRSST